jgi:hypothetical protein
MTGLGALAPHFPRFELSLVASAFSLVLRDVVDRSPIHKYNVLMMFISVRYQELG